MAAVVFGAAVALAVGGEPIRAAILVAVGFGVVGTIDNVLRPVLARVGHLRLPAVVVFIAIMGGLRLVGAWGIVLGPLFVRMGVEALSILRDEACSRRGRGAGVAFVGTKRLTPR